MNNGRETTAAEAKLDEKIVVGERLLTLEEVCRKLGGVRPWTIRGWVSQKRIPYTKVGRLTRFPERRINEWIEARTVAPAAWGGN